MAKDKDGYYVCAKTGFKSRSPLYFQINHILPMSKGGKTRLDNLQLLARWENIRKRDKMVAE